MDILKLKDKTMLIIVTDRDTEYYSLDPSKPEELLGRLLPGLAAAGYIEEGKNLYCEIFASPGGGCQIFITNAPPADEDTDGEELMNYIASGGNIDPSYFSKGTGKAGVSTPHTYKFTDFEALLGACRELSLKGKDISAALRCDESSELFFLTTSASTPIPEEFSALDVTGEGEAQPERCRVITENALDALAKFAL